RASPLVARGARRRLPQPPPGGARAPLAPPAFRPPAQRALVEAVVRRNLAAGQEPRSLPLADLRVRVDLLERRAVDHRPNVRRVLPAGPEREPLGSRNELRLQLVVYARLHDHPRRGPAALPP